MKHYYHKIHGNPATTNTQEVVNLVMTKNVLSSWQESHLASDWVQSVHLTNCNKAMLPAQISIYGTCHVQVINHIKLYTNLLIGHWSLFLVGQLHNCAQVSSQVCFAAYQKYPCVGAVVHNFCLPLKVKRLQQVSINLNSVNTITKYNSSIDMCQTISVLTSNWRYTPSLMHYQGFLVGLHQSRVVRHQSHCSRGDGRYRNMENLSREEIKSSRIKDWDMCLPLFTLAS